MGKISDEEFSEKTKNNEKIREDIEREKEILKRASFETVFLSVHGFINTAQAQSIYKKIRKRAQKNNFHASPDGFCQIRFQERSKVKKQEL